MVATRGDSGRDRDEFDAMSQPSRTLTGKSDSWSVDRRNQQKANGGGREAVPPVPMSEPAPTFTSKSGQQWVFTRPATCVMGDPRVAAPGYRGGHDDRSTTMMADAIKITLQEALILQSFDPDYPVQGNKTKQFEQVGNAVPPRLAQAVLEALVGRDASRHPKVSPEANTPPDHEQFCTCDFDPSYSGGLCDVCGKPDPTPIDNAHDCDAGYAHSDPVWPNTAPPRPPV